MLAAWYDSRGPARDVLQVGEQPDPQPGHGELRIALSVSAVSPGDVKKRAGWQGSPMPYPRVIPHSDGAGVIDAVGAGVDPARIQTPVWCYGAQSYRPYGTAASFVVVPAELAVDLPAREGTEREDLMRQASCLGIAGITAYRAVFADGPVDGLMVLVHGATGGVGSIATQMARRGGAHVLAVVRDDSQTERARSLGADEVWRTDLPDLAQQIAAVAPDGVHRIADVDLAAHIDLDAEVVAVGGSISSYYSSADRPEIPYWALGFKDVALRLLGSDDFSPTVKAHAAAELTAALTAGELRSTIARVLPLTAVAEAHELVEHGSPGKVLLDVTANPAST